MFHIYGERERKTETETESQRERQEERENFPERKDVNPHVIRA